MKEIDWKKVKITDEVMEYVIPKYGKTDWLLNDSYSQIILEDIYNTFYKDETELAKEGKVKADGIWKGTKKASVDLVDSLDLQNSIKNLSKDFNTFVKAKETKEAKEEEVVEVPSDEKDSSDEAFFGDEIWSCLIMLNIHSTMLRLGCLRRDPLLPLPQDQELSLLLQDPELSLHPLLMHNLLL
ncbi:hypothetical protein Tco_1481439 [Tanacetum coccineum]